MSLLYRIMYSVGFLPWERLPATPAAGQVVDMLRQEEEGREPPYGKALDLGCGTGIWSVRLAERGWDVTGVDIVPKAIAQARTRADEAGASAHFVQAGATGLRDADVGSGFRVVLDFGALHGLSPDRVKAAAAEVDAVAGDDAAVLMYASSPGRRGPVPRGLSRAEIEEAYQGWTVVEEVPFEATDLPTAFARTNPRWFRLHRA